MEEFSFDPGQHFKSDDMALVTYLKLVGHTPQGVGMEFDTCYWYFIKTDSLLDDVQSFGAREARVEPREYSKFFATTRSELFQTRDPIHRR